jgi:hypothetical protein
VALFVAGLLSALSSTYDFLGIIIVDGLWVVIFIRAYVLPNLNRENRKSAGLNLGLILLQGLVVGGINLFLWPGSINYIGAWAIPWGMTAVFMINLLNKRLELWSNTSRWLLATLLCWLYGYISDAGLRFLWGPSPYDLETVFYAMHFFFGTLATLTIVLLYEVQLSLRKGIIIGLVTLVGFFGGSIVFALFLSALPESLVSPRNVILLGQTIPALFGGAFAGLGITYSGRDKIL